MVTVGPAHEGPMQAFLQHPVRCPLAWTVLGLVTGPRADLVNAAGSHITVLSMTGYPFPSRGTLLGSLLAASLSLGVTALVL